MSLKAVLLDVDGTLIDSVDAHTQSWVDVCAEFGIEVEYENVRRMIGMGGDRVIRRLTGAEEDSTLGQQIADRRGEIFREEFLQTLQPFDGVRPLLERMTAAGLKLVAASSSDVKDLEKLLNRAGVKDLFEAETSSDDAASSKPAPDIIEAALRRAHCAPDEAVMIGDTPYDVRAAKRAGVACIGFRCGGWDDEALRGAVEIYDDAADMLGRWDAAAGAGSAGNRSATTPDQSLLFHLS